MRAPRDAGKPRDLVEISSAAVSSTSAALEEALGGGKAHVPGNGSTRAARTQVSAVAATARCRSTAQRSCSLRPGGRREAGITRAGAPDRATPSTWPWAPAKFSASCAPSPRGRGGSRSSTLGADDVMRRIWKNRPGGDSSPRSPRRRSGAESVTRWAASVTAATMRGARGRRSADHERPVEYGFSSSRRSRRRRRAA